MNNNTNKLILLVCCHKADSNIRKDNPYFPIQVGKALHPEVNLGFVNDNEGDNISIKNATWNEQTALYWGWKNIHDVEYMGLCHYRRYFNGLSGSNIDKYLKNHDIIAVKSDRMLSCMERADNLIRMTCQEDYYLFADTVLTVFPDCKDAFIKYFYHSRKSYPYTMFVAKKDLYDEYCHFSFSILSELEKKMKDHGYTRLNRAIGYCGEWTLGLFIYYKNLRVKELPITDYSLNDRGAFYKACRLFYRLLSRIPYLFFDLRSLKIHDIEVPSHIRVGFKSDGIKLDTL